MDKINQNIHSFQKDVFGKQQKLFERLTEGQQPDALLITCSDSRIDPNLVTQTAPGDLFVLRNAGNMIPPYGASSGGEAAAVEFAVTAWESETSSSAVTPNAVPCQDRCTSRSCKR